MTPLWGKHHEPDERPSAAATIAAACIFVLVIGMLFVLDLLKGVQP